MSTQDDRKMLENLLKNSPPKTQPSTPPTPPKAPPKTKTGAGDNFSQTEKMLAKRRLEAIAEADRRNAELLQQIDPMSNGVAKNTINYYNDKARRYDPIGWGTWTAVIIGGCGIFFILILWISLTAVDSTFDTNSRETVGEVWK